MAEALGQGLEHLVLLGLAGGVEGGQGPAVERPVGAGHDVAAAAPELAGQLDGRLVGLGTAVAEEGLVRKRMVAEQLRQFDLLRDLVIVGAVDQLRRLLLQRRDHLGMAVSQVVDRHPPQKIQVLFAIGIPQSAPFAPDRYDRVAPIGSHDVSV